MLSDDVAEHLIGEIISCHSFAIQTDESTDILNRAILLVCLRLIGYCGRDPLLLGPKNVYL
jgi:hypothetical protein